MPEVLANIKQNNPEGLIVAEPGVSFADYENKSKQISEETIMAIMSRDLEVTPGEKAFMIKSWLDQVPADESDADFTHDPQKVISFRNQLSDFVIERLAIVSRPGELDDRTRAFLRQRKQDFLEKTASDKVKVEEFVQNLDDPTKRPRYSVAEFHGMTVNTSDGKTRDLLAGEGVGSVRSNIFIQREIAGMFVHYSSRSYERARIHGVKPELSRRIYLNPRFEDSVEIFDEIVSAAEEAGIVMKGKIFDRLADGIDANARRKNAGEFATRGDGIVLCAGEDADALLRMVEAVYKDHRDAFKSRKTSKIPLKIADGIAIGDEPEEGSLTSHRAALLERAKLETERRIDGANVGKEKVVSIFRSVYEEIAKAENVDPHNIAFNLQKEAA